jgi:predicted nucleic acid-binding protein
MNLYLDASALVKRYLSEPGTPETRRVIDAADVQGTTVVSRAEVASALAKTVRMEVADQEEARALLEAFRDDWPYLSQQQVTEAVIGRAERLAFEEDLRGYDAVQLASALVWKEALAEEVTFATFDTDLLGRGWAARAGRLSRRPAAGVGGMERAVANVP